MGSSMQSGNSHRISRGRFHRSVIDRHCRHAAVGDAQLALRLAHPSKWGSVDISNDDRQSVAEIPDLFFLKKTARSLPGYLSDFTLARVRESTSLIWLRA